MTREDLPGPDDVLDDEYDEDDADADDFSNPHHPDHDLSEWVPYTTPYKDAKPWFIRRWAVILVSALVIAGLILPFIMRF